MSVLYCIVLDNLFTVQSDRKTCYNFQCYKEVRWQSMKWCHLQMLSFNCVLWNYTQHILSIPQYLYAHDLNPLDLPICNLVCLALVSSNVATSFPSSLVQLWVSYLHSSFPQSKTPLPWIVKGLIWLQKVLGTFCELSFESCRLRLNTGICWLWQLPCRGPASLNLFWSFTGTHILEVIVYILSAMHGYSWVALHGYSWATAT